MKAVILLFLLPLMGFAQSYKEVVVTNGDVDLYVKVFGEGDPIVLINGGPGMNSKGFDPLAERLSANHQVILYDQRGTGNSSMPELDEENMTMDWMVDDLEAIRAYFAFPAWIVYGHSFGGMLAYKYAADHPEHIWAMVQSSSGGMDLAIRNNVLVSERLTELERDSLTYFMDKIQSGDTTEHIMERRRYYLANAYVFNDTNLPVIRQRLKEADFTINGLLWGDMIDTQFDQSKKLKHFDAPVLILFGDHDVVHPSLAQSASDILENVNVFEIPNCGHYGWLDNPGFYFEKVNRFLDSLPPMNF